MAGTTNVEVGSSYVSLGNGPMLISLQGEIMIVCAVSQPAPSTIGHLLAYPPLPVSIPFSEQVWAIGLSNEASVDVVVTT